MPPPSRPRPRPRASLLDTPILEEDGESPNDSPSGSPSSSPVPDNSDAARKNEHRTKRLEMRERRKKNEFGMPEKHRSTPPVSRSDMMAAALNRKAKENRSHSPKPSRQMSYRPDREIDISLQLDMNRTEELLYSVYPRHVAEALKAGRKVEPETHDLVTIFFSDIVGFTDIASEMDPLKICDMLDRLYHSFDALSHYHDVFKVETIGDAYMAVTNLAKRQHDHCKRIAEFAIDCVRVSKLTLVDKEDPSKGFVNIRVGFHSGPVVSNVVGSRNPRYCLFGDAVNTASRMESNSASNRIHCSEASAKLLKLQAPHIDLLSTGGMEVKGKGFMNTFWVNDAKKDDAKKDDDADKAKEEKN